MNEELEKHYIGSFRLDTLVQQYIDAQPTAYDVEKVVAELEELENHNGNAYLDSADVIDIVKRGGAE